MAVLNPQVRLREVTSYRFEKPPRFRQKLVTIPAPEGKISSWHPAGPTHSRITPADPGPARPAVCPGVVPGPASGRKHPPLWLPMHSLKFAYRLMVTPTDVKRDPVSHCFPGFTPLLALLLSSHFQGFALAKIGKPRFSLRRI